MRARTSARVDAGQQKTLTVADVCYSFCLLDTFPLFGAILCMIALGLESWASTAEIRYSFPPLLMQSPASRCTRTRLLIVRSIQNVFWGQQQRLRRRPEPPVGKVPARLPTLVPWRPQPEGFLASPRLRGSWDSCPRYQLSPHPFLSL